EVHDLPADSPSLASSTTDETESKVDLLIQTTLGALGGSATTWVHQAPAHTPETSNSDPLPQALEESGRG
ncbi:hypothetical protein, partial [Streptomyces sp. NPDC059489]|uniref:hypothetical protein n=1 Tax=Streptomyces sp. NPDC059489 TaxID=3346849 RepID=UPI00368D8279